MGLFFVGDVHDGVALLRDGDGGGVFSVHVDAGFGSVEAGVEIHEVVAVLIGGGLDFLIAEAEKDDDSRAGGATLVADFSGYAGGADEGDEDGGDEGVNELFHDTIYMVCNCSVEQGKKSETRLRSGRMAAREVISEGVRSEMRGFTVFGRG